MHFYTTKNVYIIRMNRIFRKIFKLIPAFCCTGLLSAKEISIINWNLQTFFDANKDGCEYKEFQKSEKWNKDAYQKRLDRLCTFMNQSNADVYIFEEIENAGIIYDISNRLAGNTWSSRKCWPYGTFYKNKGDSIGCAVISRMKIKEVHVHNIDIRTEKTRQPPLRAIMEIKFEEEKNSSAPLTLFVNHWKSKAGGDPQSEIWRLWQETVLSRLFTEQRGSPALAGGDFNKDIKEFVVDSSETKTADSKPNIYLQDFLSSRKTAVFSPWFSENNSLIFPGSYYFRETWERIDHFFLSPEISMIDFTPMTDGAWSSQENLIPVRYKIHTGTGFSDHLPVRCTISLKEN